MKEYDHKRIDPPTLKLRTGKKKMAEYNHSKIESKWQKEWEKKGIYHAKDVSKKPKYYNLIEFPYPSGDGMHVGHIRSNTAMDIISRKRRMEGCNVLYPIGWDAFGLPTENYAIKTGKQPAVITKKNTDTFRRQLKSIGFSFDWSREINTTDPKYYKWTQWIFLQFLKKGLAYKAKMTINWCPKCKIGLANEEVVNGGCERCGAMVEQREKEQWMLAITKYADRLYKDLDDVDYLPQIKLGQRNWIGRSEGMLFTAPVKDTNLTLQTFSAHFEAFAADTFVVIAPDHPFLKKLVAGTDKEKEVLIFADGLVKERMIAGFENKEMKGIFTGRYIVDPVGNGDLPIWVASFALADYGTGIVKCSAHDERDFAFAKKYGIKLKPVLFPEDEDLRMKVENLEICFSDMKNGILKEPKEFNGRKGGDVREDVIKYLEKKNIAKRKTTFKLRDWIFSRQRYWGEPIPVIHCEDCGMVPVPEKDLPVELPKVKNYQPTDSGESPLANIAKWVNVKCPKCKGKAKRETDTMPNWAGSSWYYLRYTDPKNKKEFASKKNLKYWLGGNALRKTQGDAGGVDWYNGGNEHTTLHLLYSRFWHKFLFDLKLVPTSEPYKKRTSHGMILGGGGVKMSKSLGNVINPDDIVKTYGADTLRLYEMFMGPFGQSVAWSEEAIIGPRRFLERVWKIAGKIAEPDAFAQSLGSSLRSATPSQKYAGSASSFPKLLNKTIKKVGEDIEEMRFNTAVSTMMVLVNEMLTSVGKEDAEASEPNADKGEVSVKDFKKFLQILAPFAPHITEELWGILGEKKTIHLSEWPSWDKSLIQDEEIKIVVQINGKVKTEMMIKLEDSEEEIKRQALSDEVVLKYIGEKEVKKVIYVKNRLVNIVI